MSETKYLAVAFASRSANGHLRPAVSDAAPEGAKVVRTRAEAALGSPADDEERYADLIKTLDAFIRLHGSVNAVARDLFLHRNTVRQRLRRIGQLTGADLADPNDRLALQLALIGREALEHLT